MSSIVHIAKVSIELTTPLHIGSGKGADGADAGLVLDASGLPTLPGSSIQGVLRSACRELGWDPEKWSTDEWFGYGSRKKEDGSKADNGRSSHFSVVWGLIHNSKNNPLDRMRSEEDILRDPVLRNAYSPSLRDHVRLDHRRTSEDKGKFDEFSVPPGHRFTFELKLISSGGADDGHWQLLLDALSDPLLRFGGKTRRGYGAFKVIGIDQTRFDFSQPQARTAYQTRGVEITSPATAKPASPAGAFEKVDLSCELTAEGLWMIGGGADEEADLAPVRGTQVVWDTDSKGSVVDSFFIPGTAVKGALAHRTCFHANRLAGIFADQIMEADFKEVTESGNAVVRNLFGDVVDHDSKTGSPGRIYVDDVYFPVVESDLLPPQNHVAIDPFTGGARDTALFQDRPLMGGTFTIPIHLKGLWDPEEKCEIMEGKSANPKDAFEAALENLQQGSLAIGAHSSRGYGFFKTASLENV